MQEREALERRCRLLQGVVDATHRLLTQADHSTAIREALQILRTAADVDRVYIFEKHRDSGNGDSLVSERFGWSRRKQAVEVDPPAFQSVRYREAGFADWEERLQRGESVGGAVRSFSPAKRAYLERERVQSLLLVPILIEHRLWGLIGFDDCKGDRIWSREDESILVTMAACLGALLARRQVEGERARLVGILDATSDFVGILDARGEQNYLNPAGRRMIGVALDAQINDGPAFQRRHHPDWALRLILEKGLPLARREGVWSGETAFLSVGGDEIPVSQVVMAHRDADGRVAFFSTIARDIRRLKEHEQQISSLLEVVKDISGTLDLEEIFDRVQRRCADLLPCERVIIFHWDSERQVFRLVSEFGIPEPLLSDAIALEFAPNDQMVRWLSGGEALLVNDVAEQPPGVAELLRRFRVTALILAPLFIRGQLLGAIGAVNATEGKGFGLGQMSLLQNIARQLALSMEAATLYRSQQEEAHVSGALARFGQEMISSLDTPSLLDRLCQLSAESLGCDCSHTLLWQANEAAYVPVAGYGDTPAQWERIRNLRIPSSRLPGLRQFEHTDVVEAASAEARKYGVTSALHIALRRGGELVGIQTASYRGRRAPFTPVQQRIAKGIAQIASMALANTRLVEELKRANRLKDDFVATMSHELRTPLNVIIGYNDLLLDGAFGPVTGEQRDTLVRVNRSAWELLDLINATLDVSRIESGHLPLHLETIRIAELMKDIDGETREIRTKPDIVFNWSVASDLPLIRSDPFKLKVVLKNLISNAIKFTERGQVTIEARSDGGDVEILVTDTGIGIAPDARGCIFEPFRQLDGSMTRRYGGAGLGLYIARRLLDLMGGSIWVQSEVGRGSCFRVRLPISVGEP